MKFHSFVIIAACAFASGLHGQSVLLDWSSATAWSNGSTTGSYNTLSGAGGVDGATNAISTLTYDFGGGLTAEVSAVLTGTANWQNGGASPNPYGGYAPRAANGVFAFGISDATGISGATLQLSFNQAVRLNAVTIGDLDNSGTQDLVQVAADSALFHQSSAANGPGIANNGTSALSLTGISAPENNFSATAPTAWTTLGSGTNWINSLTVSLAGGTNGHGIWVSNLTVSPSPIPEPSTYALVLGFSALGLIFVRRRFVRRS